LFQPHVAEGIACGILGFGCTVPVKQEAVAARIMPPGSH
jgi:hypothetical protein